MEDTFDELVTKHTRRELEEMALEHGVENLGGTKAQLAEAITEAIEQQKAKTMPAFQQKPPEGHVFEKSKVPAEPKALLGKKGVKAKISAFDNKSAEIQKAGQDIRDEGIIEMTNRVRELHSATDKMSRDMAAGVKAFKDSVNAQIGENRDCKAKFDAGVNEIHSSTENMSGEFQRAGRNIRDEGCRNMQKGLKQFQSGVASQIKENRDAASKMDSGARELQGRTRSFQQDVQRYQEQDLKNYVRDFYYG